MPFAAFSQAHRSPLFAKVTLVGDCLMRGSVETGQCDNAFDGGSHVLEVAQSFIFTVVQPRLMFG